jgi:hypothetical protein
VFNVSFEAYRLQHQFNMVLNMFEETIRRRPDVDPRKRSFIAWELLAINSRLFWEFNEKGPAMPECAD